MKVNHLNTSILDNRLQTCRLLLQYEADPNLQVPDGYSALHLFLQQVSLTNVIPEREILDVIKILLDSGANINLQDNRGRTPIFEILTLNPEYNIELLYDIIKYLIMRRCRY